MAELFKWTEDERLKWADWVESRPPAVQALARRLPPNLLYRMKSSGHRVTIYSYAEDGTLTVVVSGEYNVVAFERRVFGISPDDLEETELPSPDEPVGSADMTIEQVRKMMSNDAGATPGEES